MEGRKGRAVIRYTDDEWARVKDRCDEGVPFATWLRRLSLGQGVGTGVSESYLGMLQNTRQRAIEEALSWRRLNALLGLPEGSPPEAAAEKLRDILS